MVSELFSFKADSCDAWPLLRSAQASARTCGTSAYENLVFPKPLSLGRQRAKLPPRDLNTYISHSRVFVCHSSAIGGGHESSCSHGPCLALSCCNSPRVKPEEGVRALAKTFGYHRRHFKIDDLRLRVSSSKVFFLPPTIPTDCHSPPSFIGRRFSVSPARLALAAFPSEGFEGWVSPGVRDFENMQEEPRI